MNCFFSVRCGRTRLIATLLEALEARALRAEHLGHAAGGDLLEDLVSLLLVSHCERVADSPETSTDSAKSRLKRGVARRPGCPRRAVSSGQKRLGPDCVSADARASLGSWTSTATLRRLQSKQKGSIMVSSRPTSRARRSGYR